MDIVHRSRNTLFEPPRWNTPSICPEIYFATEAIFDHFAVEMVHILIQLDEFLPICVQIDRILSIILQTPLSMAARVESNSTIYNMSFP